LPPCICTVLERSRIKVNVLLKIHNQFFDIMEQVRFLPAGNIAMIPLTCFVVIAD